MPKMPTAEDIQKYKEWEAEHEKKLQTDPEYKAKWERERAFLERVFPKRDSDVFAVDKIRNNEK